ncbi:ATP-binding cassette domain-containing protein [Paraburkholderia silvatlantica]|uniref:ATP-binding cassette domain-containing protein n=1 Tax=Paraburkholderia silvatlantica TaxID=321895 RepID=UPI00375047B2
MNTVSTDHGAVAEVRGAVKRYGGVLALDHVDFAIHAGEVRALLGKNGAGKSTLIRLAPDVRKWLAAMGGTSLSGGRGSMTGTLLGVLVITLIGNGLVLMGVNPFFQQVVRGFIIVIAVLMNIGLGKRGSH